MNRRDALRIAGRGEVEAPCVERGVVDVACEFCNRRHTFGPAEARDRFTPPPGNATAGAESPSFS